MTVEELLGSADPIGLVETEFAEVDDDLRESVDTLIGCLQAGDRGPRFAQALRALGIC